MGALESFRNEMLEGIEKNLSLIRGVNSIIDSSSLNAEQKVELSDLLVEWAFVRVHVTWESFVENCFITYMLGVRSASGFGPKRYVFPRDKEHASSIILAGKDYFQWTVPSRVTECARLYFENGDPFEELDSLGEDLTEMNTVRNAVVHRSSVAMERFRTLVRGKLSTAPLGITPGRFLVRSKPGASQRTYLNYYCNKLKVAAQHIVPS